MSEDLRPQRLLDFDQRVEILHLYGLDATQEVRDLTRPFGAEIDHVSLHVVNAADDVVRRELRAQRSQARSSVARWKAFGLEADHELELEAALHAIAECPWVSGIRIERSAQAGWAEVLFTRKQVFGAIARSTTASSSPLACRQN